MGVTNCGQCNEMFDPADSAFAGTCDDCGITICDTCMLDHECEDEETDFTDHRCEWLGHAMRVTFDPRYWTCARCGYTVTVTSSASTTPRKGA